MFKYYLKDNQMNPKEYFPLILIAFSLSSLMLPREKLPKMYKMCKF